MLHEAMKRIIGERVMLIGFTGTPLLHTDKKKSVETFGSYIHSYKFHEAVRDNVILDLRYEARNVEQFLGKREKIDEWFDSKTAGLSKVARSLLKARWARWKNYSAARSVSIASWRIYAKTWVRNGPLRADTAMQCL